MHNNRYISKFIYKKRALFQRLHSSIGELLFAFLLVFWLSSFSIAAPTSLTYQGRILKADGTPLEYSNVSFIFQITDPSGQCVIYQEQINSINMTNSAGVFDVPIGTAAIQYPLGGSATVLDVFNNSSSYTCGSCSSTNGVYSCANGSGTYTATANDIRKLRVSFYDGSGWKLITPDNTIRSVPFAAYSLSAQKLGTNSASDFLLKAGLPTCGAGTFLTWSGSALTCDAVSGTSGGTVTAVTSANSYLSVATGTSTPVLTVNVGTIAGTLAAGNDSRITGAFQASTSLGGDLTGTLPNPTVSKINGVTVSSAVAGDDGKFLKFVNGSGWQPQFVKLSELKNATGASSAFNVGSCTAAQTLVWSSITDQFSCQDISLPASKVTGLATVATSGAYTDLTGTPTLNSLLPTQTGQSGKFLYTDGTNASWTANPSQWTTSGSDIYYNAGNVGIGTTSPSFRLNLGDGTTNDGAFIATGIGVGSGQALSANGAGTRMFWYPKKAAFRAGTVSGTEWDDANIGSYSVAMGLMTIASGTTATAIGLTNTASGSSSVALGSLTTASGSTSFAMGTSATASGTTSASIGSSSTANGNNSFAAGYNTTADSYLDFAIGRYNLGGGTASSWVSTDPLLEIGVGTSNAARANAMTVLKNGNVGIGTASPTANLEVVGGGNSTLVKESATVTGTTATIYGHKTDLTFSPTAVNSKYAYGGNFTATYTAGAGVDTSGGAVGLSGNASLGNFGQVSYLTGGYFMANKGNYTTTNTTGLSSLATSSGGTGTNSYALQANSSLFNSGITNNYGVYSDIYIDGTSTLPKVYGGYFKIENGSTFGPSVTDAYGLYSTISRASGTISNGYGIYVGAIQSTSKYSIYASDSTAPSYFAGNVGIGTTSAAAKLDVTDAGTTTSAIIVPRAGAFTGTTVNGMIRYNSTSNLFEFYQNGSWVNYTTVSDARLKTNIIPVTSTQGLDIVNQLNPVFYNWNKNNPRTETFGTQHQVGFIAQEVEKVLPEVVNVGEDSYRSVEYGKIVSVVVAAVKELYNKFVGHDEQLSKQARLIASIQTQASQKADKTEIEMLKAENADLKARLERIEKMLQEK